MLEPTRDWERTRDQLPEPLRPLWDEIGGGRAWTDLLCGAVDALAMDRPLWLRSIFGLPTLHVRPRAWGHLLSEHYLGPIDRVQKHRRQVGPRRPGAAPFRLLNRD